MEAAALEKCEVAKVEGLAAKRAGGKFLVAPPVLFSNAALPLLAVELADEIKGPYAVSLGLFFLSLPGLWSTVKRSTKSKVVQRTFLVDGPAKPGAEPLDKFARQVTTYFKSNNYKISSAGEVITFEGAIAASKGTAAYITFCVFVGLLSLGLVLSIAKPEFGNAWYGLTLFSPLTGYYYFSKAERVEEVQVKMVTADDELTTEIRLQGSADEIERFQKTLNLMEKDKIYVKGLFETEESVPSLK